MTENLNNLRQDQFSPIIASKRKTDTKTEYRIQTALSSKRSSSESSLTSFLGSSDSEKSLVAREKIKLPNPQERKNFHFNRIKTKDNNLVSSTPLHRKVPHLKIDNWPSPIAVLHSQFSITRRKNVKDKISKLREHNLICSSTPQSVFHDQNEWPSSIQKKSTELQNKSSNYNLDESAYPPSLKMQENSRSVLPIGLQDRKELRLLRRKSSISRYGKQNENNQADFETVMEQAVHTEDRGDIKRLKKTLPKENIKNVVKTSGVTAEASSTPVNANKERKTAYHPPVRRMSPRKLKSSISTSETKHVNENVDASDNDAGYKTGITSEASSTAVNANRERKTAYHPPVRRMSPRKVQSSINTSETKHVNKNVDTSDNNADDEEDVSTEASAKRINSNKVTKSKGDSLKKVKRNPHKVQSPESTIRSASGRKRQAASNDFVIKKNDKTGKESKIQRKATSSTSRTKTERKEKFVAVPGNENGLRKSTRTRIKPVSHWIGERVQYKIGPDWCQQVVGVNPGQNPENSSYVQRKKNNKNSSSNNENPDFELAHLISNRVNPKRKLVQVPFMGSETSLECFSTHRFDGNLTEESDQKISIFTSLEIPGIESGYISIAPSLQITDTAHDVMQFVFCIITGAVSVTIHKAKRKLRKGDCFCVTQGVTYSIENINDSEAVLFFTRIVR